MEAVALARVRPLSGGGWGERIQFDGQPKAIPVLVNAVSSGHFSAMGIDITAGHGLTPRDSRDQAYTAVVSEEMAWQLGSHALGARFRDGDRKFEVVGIARRARHDSMARQSAPVLYLPHPLEHDAMTVVVRTRTAPAGMIEPVRRTVAELDPALPIVGALTMDQQIGETLRRERLFAWLCGCFGVLALTLCAIGLYGVLSYATARRAREIGIRMALGATPQTVLRMVLGEGSRSPAPALPSVHRWRGSSRGAMWITSASAWKGRSKPRRWDGPSRCWRSLHSLRCCCLRGALRRPIQPGCCAKTRVVSLLATASSAKAM
ncbi:MAG: FtsX-like permease family protein [Acidobacteria bacterium]|nr:FtsX-like permease family protein [Acidobacteriota bacterium]